MRAESWQRAEIPGPSKAVVITEPERIPPCRDRCPIGNNIPEFVHLCKQGRFEEAVEVLKSTNPLPATCGRVCYHPCEEGCTRGGYDEGVGIHNIERWLGDFALQKVREKKTQPSHLPKVAVVGSGPAGISCAYHLARKGYRVTIFEALPVVGGTPAVGIPTFRLPKDILEREIKALEALGVEIKVNHPVRSLEELKGYEAVFLATGAMKSTKLGVPGEEAEGVLPGMDFLREVNLGREVKVGKRVLVIGGGNTAIDCARVSLRLGATVTILYRRSKEEMPATEEEVEEALSEGVRIEFLVAPKRVLTEGGKVVGLECLRMRLGEPDASGRRRPVPIEGSEFRVEADTVIAAIGQEPDLSYLPKEVQTERGYIRADEFGRTSLPGVFAGGDVVWGSNKRVSDAIGWGKRVAEAIEAYLKGEAPRVQKKPPVVEAWEINTDYFELEPRVKMPVLSMEERKTTFKEVNLGYQESSTKKEAKRCFHCGAAVSVEDIHVVVSLIREAKNPIFVVGHEATKIELNGVKPIDHVIRIAKAANIPVVVTAQTAVEFRKRGFQPAVRMAMVEICSRLTDPKWSLKGDGQSHDLVLMLGLGPYYMEWLMGSAFKSFAPHLKTISLNRFYYPHSGWSFPNLSVEEWYENMEKIAEALER